MRDLIPSRFHSSTVNKKPPPKITKNRTKTRGSIRAALFAVVGITVYAQLSKPGPRLLTVLRATSDAMRARESILSGLSFYSGVQPEEKVHLDPQGLYIPAKPDTCPSDIIFRTIIDTPDHLLRSCVPTSLYQVEIPEESGRKANKDSSWLLHSLDSKGVRKTEGGDEIYVTYRDEANESVSPTAIAHVVDLENGSYELNFVNSRSPALKDDPNLTGFGSITINLEYTCSAGILDPPTKKTWTGSGLINTMYTSGPTYQAPPIRNAEYPNKYPELSSYDIVYGIGSTLMGDFILKTEKGIGRKPNLSQPFTVVGPLNSETVYDQFLPRVRETIGYDVEKNGGTAVTNGALILGSCAWDLMAQETSKSFDGHKNGWFEMEDHLKSIETLVTTVRKEFPDWKLYWKGCTALQAKEIPQVIPFYWTESVYYVSSGRSRNLDWQQKKLLLQLDVPVLDMWSMSFEMAEFLKNFRHYSRDFNQYAVDYFYGDAPTLTKVTVS